MTRPRFLVSGDPGALSAPTSCQHGAVTHDMSDAHFIVSGNALAGAPTSVATGKLEPTTDLLETATVSFDCTRALRID